MGKVGQASKAAGQQHRKSFGGGARADLAGYAKGLGGVVAGIGLITGAFREAEEAKNQALASLRTSEQPLSSLAQLADTKEEMAALVEAAKQTFAEGATKDLGSAANLVFSLQSAGAMDQRKMFAELGSRGLVADPAMLAKASKTLFESMGEAETGNLRDIVSKGFGASAYSPSTVEELLEASARSGPTAAALKMSDEEVLAGTAILATATGEAARGATGLSALLKAFDKKGGFKGLGLAGGIEKVQAMKMTDPEQVAWFGRAEGLQAFRILSADMGKLGSIIAKISEAQAQDKTGIKLGLPSTVAQIKASQAVQASENVEVLTKEAMGILRGYSDTLLSEARTAMRDTGVPEQLVALENMYAKARRFVMGDKGFVGEQESPSQQALAKIVPFAGVIASWFGAGPAERPTGKAGRIPGQGGGEGVDVSRVEDNTERIAGVNEQLLDESRPSRRPCGTSTGRQVYRAGSGRRGLGSNSGRRGVTGGTPPKH